MPKSKRNTVLDLTKTKKKTREQKGALIEEIQLALDTFQFVWIFQVNHTRNQYIQEIRAAWKPSKIFMGRNGLMRKALGATAEDEHARGSAHIGQMLEGNVGLLFTDCTPKEVVEYFESYKKSDFARTGNLATETIELPQGPVLMEGEPAPHSIEPQLRKAGMPTSLIRGVPTLAGGGFTVCKAGQTLSPEQVQLLKLFNKPMATFQIVPLKGLDVKAGSVIEVDSVQVDR
ncbi:uncharacterized protein L969DRAFT_91233 [Mixia osmundae IAM 14324]|uniref:Ribosome assembly factor mrt4 n=1 Tax=Mixia osmundae (strain CBS 9802 / IAM 14324 / JCM 22182 / KY 12970) TaxID=764103 RepID=G7E2Q8_MIXOS|nr:uncharacterized protein L969DRAFT_91233 [Mixia osmundae IAM 14324]KEI36135.1 hypothetical protein L969DRAFT_91233 [Mixia osmundae IAM 14324]GAA97118.1 hypothetical protein E5Q_03793 [Mixia osmundae IAM 14324]